MSLLSAIINLVAAIVGRKKTVVHVIGRQRREPLVSLQWLGKVWLKCLAIGALFRLLLEAGSHSGKPTPPELLQAFEAYVTGMTWFTFGILLLIAWRAAGWTLDQFSQDDHWPT